MLRWLGIDFSGNHMRWREHHQTSNVWVAAVEDNHGLSLTDLQRVQQFVGVGCAFAGLVCWLHAGEYQAAAIDAPFSVPKEHVPGRSHHALLQMVDGMEHPHRPFPDGGSFFRAVTGQTAPLDPPKPLRSTEQIWKDKGCAVRSTLWNGRQGYPGQGRPGTPMTAACLELLARAERPIWPWAGNDEPGLLVEAFPAAQLRQWAWPTTGYNAAVHIRQEIIERLEQFRELSIPQNFRNQMLASADALDAVLCAFASIAVTEQNLAVDPEAAIHSLEGWIAVSS